MGTEFWLNVWRQEVLWGFVELLGFILVYDGWQRCYFAFGSWWDTALSGVLGQSAELRSHVYWNNCCLLSLVHCMLCSE